MNDKISNATRLVAILACAALLQGCVSTAQFKTNMPGSTLALRGGSDKKDLPRSEDLGSKATGQYQFMATPPQGEPLYGILPLKVNGGKIVASIMFFAPALFIGGFRDPYGFYEFDPTAKALRYKQAETDDWYTYIPTTSESERAKVYFEALARGCTVSNVNGQETMNCPPTAAPATGK